MSNGDAWYFAGCSLRDGSGKTLPEDGETIIWDGPMRDACDGYLACRRAIDALDHADGTTLCRVRMGGERIDRSTFSTVSEWTIPWRVVDGEAVLRGFMLWCAESALRHWPTAPGEVKEYFKDSANNNARIRARERLRFVDIDRLDPASRAAFWAVCYASKPTATTSRVRAVSRYAARAIAAAAAEERGLETTEWRNTFYKAFDTELKRQSTRLALCIYRARFDNCVGDEQRSQTNTG